MKCNKPTNERQKECEKQKHQLTLITINRMVLKVVLSQDSDESCGISDRGFLIVLDPLKISLCELNGWIWIAKVAPFWAELFSLDWILKEYSQVNAQKRGVCYPHGFLIFRHLFYSKYFLVGCQTIGSHFSDFMIFCWDIHSLFHDLTIFRFPIPEITGSKFLKINILKRKKLFGGQPLTFQKEFFVQTISHFAQLCFIHQRSKNHPVISDVFFSIFFF